jgi:hypothetical protein
MAEAGKSTWVPILATTLRCECNKCHRCESRFYPLPSRCHYRCWKVNRTLHYSLDEGCRIKMPGIFYVAVSRPMASGDFSLAGDLTHDALASVGASGGWKKQDSEMARLIHLSMQARRNAQSVVTKPWQRMEGCHHGSRQDYVNRIAEFVSLAEAELLSASNGNPLQPPALGSAEPSVRSECKNCLDQWRASFLRKGEQV